MGCTPCVERVPAEVPQVPPGPDVRPSLRRYRQPDTEKAVGIAALIAETVRAGIPTIPRDGR